MRIAIFKFNHLGDNVVFVPAVQALRRLHPDWHLTVMTTPNEADLYGGPLGPQEILVSPKQRFDKSYRRPWTLARWMWRVRRLEPDACLISFDQATAAHLVARHSGARVRIGGNLGHIRVARSLTEEVAMPADGCPATWHWGMVAALLRALGAGGGLPDTAPPPDLAHLVPPGTAPAPGRPRVVVHAGASRYLNQWPLERFAAVASSLARDCEVTWVEHGGTTGTAPPGTLPAPVGSLRELAGRLARADLFLGNNSGPMHLANALGRPGVVVTGPSAMGWNPYWHRERWTVLRHPSLACSPCERPNKALEGCVNAGEPMACLNYWTADRVEGACRARLGSAAGGRP
jgi:ADP-heptose:LPS heptosyltransferase